MRTKQARYPHKVIEVVVPDIAKCRQIIRKWMDDNGVTYRELGDRCGIAGPNVYRILHGKQVPTKRTIDRLFDAIE